MISETLCEHCVFKKYDSKGHQSGCMLNRLEKLPHHKSGKFFVVDTYCGACRNVYWMQGNRFSTMHEMTTAVMDEMRMSYDIFAVDSDKQMNIDEVADVKSIDRFINHITNLSYKFNKAHIILKMTQENIDKCNKYSGVLPRNITIHFSAESTRDAISQIAKNSKSPYLLMCSISETKIDSAILHDFNESLNVRLEPKSLHACDDFFLVPKFLYVHFMNKENPFQSIIDYVSEQSKPAPSQCTDSELQLPSVGD